MTNRSVERAPLFCVPATGSPERAFSALGSCLSATLRVHELPAREPGGEGGIAAAAESCLRAIGQVHTSGDIHLLGHLDGGPVALEIALRMQRAGGTVASVTLVDSGVPPGDGDAIGNDRGEAFQGLLEALERGAEHTFGYAPLALAPLDVATRRELVSERLKRCGFMVQGVSPRELDGPLPALPGDDAPSAPYAGLVRLVLLRNPALDEAGNLRRWAAQVAGWRRWTPGLAAYICLANRNNILQLPKVVTLASRLTEAPLVVTDGRLIPGHLMVGDWALPGVPLSYIDIPALWAFCPHRVECVEFAEICVKPLDLAEHAANRAATARYQRADTSFPGFVVDGMPNPCDLRYRMIDGRRRIHKLMAAGLDRGEFYVFDSKELAPFVRTVQLQAS
jgi:thioesterase domain-containing protein